MIPFYLMFKLLSTLNYFSVIPIMSQDQKLNALCRRKTDFFF